MSSSWTAKLSTTSHYLNEIGTGMHAALERFRTETSEGIGPRVAKRGKRCRCSEQPKSQRSSKSVQ